MLRRKFNSMALVGCLVVNSLALNLVHAEPLTAATLDQKVNLRLQQLMQKYAIPGAAVLVYQNGQMHQYVFGYMNKNQAPVSSKTIFELGSVTKSFTGLLLAQQVARGNLKLDDLVANYLPAESETSSSIKQISWLELATHSSSLPYNAPNLAYNADNSRTNNRKLSQFLQTWHATYPIGSGSFYSNLGFGLLGQALAKHSNQAYSAELQENIFEPLNMHTSYLTLPSSANRFYAAGFNAEDVPARTPNPGIFPGSWAIKSNIGDMANYLQLALGLHTQPPQLITAMELAQTGYIETPNSHQLGLGWTVIPLANETKANLLKIKALVARKKNQTPIRRIAQPHYTAQALIEKTGATDGFRAYIGVIPAQNVGVVILINKFIYDPAAIEHTGRELLFMQ